MTDAVYINFKSIFLPMMSQVIFQLDESDDAAQAPQQIPRDLPPENEGNAENPASNFSP